MMQQMMGQMQQQQPQAPKGPEPMDLSKEDDEADKAKEDGPATMDNAKAVYEKGDSIKAARLFLRVAKAEEEAAKATVKVGAVLETSYGNGTVSELKTGEDGTTKYAIVQLKAGFVSLVEEQA